jgi:hypothetical protein
VTRGVQFVRVGAEGVAGCAATLPSWAGRTVLPWRSTGAAGFAGVVTVAVVLPVDAGGVTAARGAEGCTLVVAGAVGWAGLVLPVMPWLTPWAKVGAAASSRAVARRLVLVNMVSSVVAGALCPGHDGNIAIGFGNRAAPPRCFQDDRGGGGAMMAARHNPASAATTTWPSTMR